MPSPASDASICCSATFLAGPDALRKPSSCLPIMRAKVSVPIACSSTRDHAAIHWSRNCFHCAIRSGAGAEPWVITFDHAAMPWSMKGRQKAWGSMGGAAPGAPCPIIFSQAWVPSSTWRFHMSSSCWLVLSAMASFPGPRLRPRGQPGRHLRPAMHRGAASGDQRDVSSRQLHVLLVARAHDVDERLHARGRRDVVLLGPDREHRAVDLAQVHAPTRHRELALDARAHDVDERLHARGRRDVVLLGPDREHRAVDLAQVHAPTRHRELALDEAVLLVEV